MTESAAFVIIPPNVLCDPRLSAGEKMVYGRVFGFIKAHGYCSATNDYLGEHIGMSKNTVRNYLSRLYELGYLRYEVLRTDRNEISERRIYPTLVPAEVLPLIPSEVLPSTTPRTAEGTEEIKKRSKDNVREKTERRTGVVMSDSEAEYYGSLLADILRDSGSVSYYKAVVRRFDPHKLIEKAKTIIADGGARNPAAVFVDWVKTEHAR